LVVGVVATGGGGAHGPGRHMPSGGGSGDHTATIADGAQQP
jgi:hypothetical protein